MGASICVVALNIISFTQTQKTITKTKNNNNNNNNGYYNPSEKPLSFFFLSVFGFWHIPYLPTS